MYMIYVIDGKNVKRFAYSDVKTSFNKFEELSNAHRGDNVLIKHIYVKNIVQRYGDFPAVFLQNYKAMRDLDSQVRQYI